MKQFLLITLLLAFMQTSFSQNSIIEANNEFAFYIYNKTKVDSANFFISPFSLSIAFSALLEGAANDTKVAIEQLMQLDRQDSIAEQYQKLIRKTCNTKDKLYEFAEKTDKNKEVINQLFIANSLWINQKYPIKESYINKLQNYYQSQVFSFKKKDIQETNQKINHWVAENTGNNIQKIEGIDDKTIMSILNAIFFLGEWEYPFSKTETYQETFYNIDSTENKIDFMHCTRDMNYYSGSDWQAIELPYRYQQFSMVVVLPDKRHGLNQLEESFSSDDLFSFFKNMSTEEVQLSLPKFKIETNLPLKEKLIKLEHGLMFSNDADFSKMTGKKKLKAGKITHKTFFEIDEIKSKAAAVTKIDMVEITSSPYDEIEYPKTINIDHPFLFFIYDNRTNVILFMGRYVYAGY